MPSKSDVPVNEAEFAVNETGEFTGNQYPGTFKIKLRLSHRDRLRLDQMRRELLGPSPDGQPPLIEAANTAEIFSYLWTRIISAPSWWVNAGNGIDLEDNKVVSVVYAKTVEKVNEAIEALNKKGDEAKEDLKKVGQTEISA